MKNNYPNKIKQFQGYYRFLSNFWLCPISLDGTIYPSIEHAYQALKCISLEDKNRILHCKSPGEAKKTGREVPIRADWEEVKIKIMLNLLRKKFEIPELRKKLLVTGNLYLMEGNYWGDGFWGVDLKTGKGENHLGELLMIVRREIRIGGQK